MLFKQFSKFSISFVVFRLLKNCASFYFKFNAKTCPTVMSELKNCALFYFKFNAQTCLTVLSLIKMCIQKMSTCFIIHVDNKLSFSVHLSVSLLILSLFSSFAITPSLCVSITFFYLYPFPHFPPFLFSLSLSPLPPFAYSSMSLKSLKQ